VVRNKGKNAAFLELARNVVTQAELAAQDQGPKIEISD
jgi:hypothetical protein